MKERLKASQEQVNILLEILQKKRIMKTAFLPIFLLFSAFTVAQKKDNCDNIIKLHNDIFSVKKPPIESVKKCLSKYEKKIRIEVINNGEYNKFVQYLSLDFIKVNNNDFSPILKYSENTPEIIVDKTSDETNWKDGYGGNLYKHSIMVSQSYLSPEDNPNLLLKEVEIYETSAPILSSVFRVFTYRKDFDYSNPAHLNKTINIYADDKLILTKTYSQEEVEKTEGVILELKL